MDMASETTYVELLSGGEALATALPLTDKLIA
jgi:hypothetical protein